MTEPEERMPSVECLSPGYYSKTRNSNVPGSVFNLISTIIGGGILSLPYAFSKLGIILGPLVMIMTALISDYSVYLLVAAARRTGSSSYQELLFKTFGFPAKVTILVCLVLLLVLASIAYVTLTHGLFVPIANMILGKKMSHTGGWFMTAIILAAIFPLCLMKSIGQLKFVSFFAVLSMSILAISVVIKYAQSDVQLANENIVFFTDNIENILFGFPVILVSFVCHFNVLPMHSELIEPTRDRLKIIFHSVMGFCVLLYGIVGALAYLTFTNELCSNVLINYDDNDPWITVGRIGVGLTIVLSTPLLIQPCRSSLIKLIRVIIPNKSENEEERVSFLDPKKEKTEIEIVGGTPDSPFYQRRPSKSRISDEVVDLDNLNEIEQPSGLSVVYHVLQTMILMVFVFTLAYLIDSLSTIWSILGSTLCILIAFFFPSACYLKVRRHKPLSKRKVSAWALLIFSICAIIACTYEAINAIVKHESVEPAHCAV